MLPPDLLSVSSIQERLSVIFPEGMQNRAYFTREMAARVVFVMLYIGATEGEDQWLGPKHVYIMSDEQAALQSDEQRIHYGANAWKPGFQPIGKRWYADTTREPIRDETLRDGFENVGAVIQKPDVPTTSGRPRYAMRADFAALFSPKLPGDELETAIAQWQNSYLDALALARMALLREGAATMSEKVSVTLPNGVVRQLSPGPSSFISKAVVEVFAPQFLHQPAVVLLSESGDKIVAQEEALTKAIGLKIQIDKLLPDIILFDLQKGRELLIFVEVVATDGPISETRKQALLIMAEGARISAERIAFVTAYLDRNRPAFKKTFNAVAWGTLIWFAIEPDYIVVMRERPQKEKARIFDLLQ
jgi:hypothetical protein